MGFVNEFDNRRTIDHDRNAWLEQKNSTPMGWRCFSLHWGEDEVEFFAYPHVEEHEDKKQSISWVFFNLKIPEHLSEKKAELSEMIQEALIAFGMHHSHKYLKDVSAEPGRPPPESRCA